MAICPLAVEWGNVADWAAVVVAAAGAVAVLLMTRAANKTARASHDLAKQLKDREEEIRSADRTVLTTLIYGEIQSAKLSYEELLEELVHDGSFDWAVGSEKTLQLVAHMAKGPPLTRTKESSQRLNLLPVALSEQIARGISMTELCELNAESLLRARSRKAQSHAFDTLVNSINAASVAFSSAYTRIQALMH